jgi:hypothetical protein
LRDPIAALFLATFLCFLSFKVVLHLRDNNEKYGLYFLQCMFSIFAFSRLTREWWRPIERCELMVDWLRLAKWGTLCLGLGGVLIGVVARVTHRHTEIHSFAIKVLLCFLTVVLILGILKLAKQGPAVQRPLSAVFTGVLLIGFLGWIPDWLNYGEGRMKLDVTLTPGEVRGLFRLRELDRQSDRFATNKHVNESSFNKAQRSYGYTALSERPVLLEGYLARGETFLPAFSQLLHDNELMFTTSDPETLHTLTEAYRVRWLVARPGTDIALSRSLPSWLVKQQDCGDLTIYQVVPYAEASWEGWHLPTPHLQTPRTTGKLPGILGAGRGGRSPVGY